MCEVDLYPKITDFFRKQSILFKEVPFHRKRIDLLYTNIAFTTIYSVEAKLDNWKVALKQAAVNQVVSHYSYVALPKKKVDTLSKEILSIFEKYGVGILSVGLETKLVLNAQKSSYLKEEKLQQIRDNLNRLLNNSIDEKIGQIKNGISKRTFSMEFLQTRAN